MTLGSLVNHRLLNLPFNPIIIALGVVAINFTLLLPYSREAFGGVVACLIAIFSELLTPRVSVDSLTNNES